MQCDDLKELMSEQIDGRLNAERQKLFFEHLSKCEKCRLEFSSIKETISMVRGLATEEPPSDLLKRIHQKIEEEPEGQVLAFTPNMEKKPAGLSSVFSLPQFRVAIAASLLLAVGIYGFKEKLGGKRQGLESVAQKGVEDANLQHPISATVLSATAPETDKMVRRNDAVISMKKMESVSTTETPTGGNIVGEAKAKRKSVDEAVAPVTVLVPAKLSDEPRDIHSRSIALNQPTVMNQQNQRVVTSVAKEQGKAVFAESADAGQIRELSAQSRTVQQITNALLDRQAVKQDVQGRMRSLLIITGDPGGVVEILKKHILQSEEKSVKGNTADRKYVYSEKMESADKTVVNLQILSKDYAVLVEKLKEKGDVTLSLLACDGKVPEGKDVERKGNIDMYNGASDRSVLEVSVTIVSKK